MVFGVPADTMDRDELDALIELLDDDDNVVRNCVDERLRSFGPQVVGALLDAGAGDKAESLNTEFRLGDLKRLLVRSGGSVSLFDGAFMVCSIADCTLRRRELESSFFKCVSEYQKEASDDRTAFENIGVFNHIFFERLGFTLYDMGLSNPEYALVSKALENRSCNPLTMVYVYIMVAQTCGLPLLPLCFQGGVVPVYMENGKELFYVNVYRKGEIFYRHNLGASLKFIGSALGNIEFKVRDERSLLAIYVESLQIVFSRSGSGRLSSALESVLALIGPERFLTI